MTVRVIGIDPGTIRTGWGIIEADGTRLRYVGAGTIHAPERNPLEARLRILFEGLVEVFAAHAPSAVAVEEVYVGKHVSAALALGHARGIALLAASQRDIVVHSYAASVVKRAVVGRGAAEKSQVAALVGALLGLRELPGIDATDALAIAITHAQTLRLRELDLIGIGKPRRR
jgi:crossover junction endodeoxyribonuclease RuvC